MGVSRQWHQARAWLLNLDRLLLVVAKDGVDLLTRIRKVVQSIELEPGKVAESIFRNMDGDRELLGDLTKKLQELRVLERGLLQSLSEHPLEEEHPELLSTETRKTHDEASVELVRLQEEIVDISCVVQETLTGALEASISRWQQKPKGLGGWDYDLSASDKLLDQLSEKLDEADDYYDSLEALSDQWWAIFVAQTFKLGDPQRRWAWGRMLESLSLRLQSYHSAPCIARLDPFLQRVRKAHVQLFLLEVPGRVSRSAIAPQSLLGQESDEEFLTAAAAAGVPSHELLAVRDHVRSRHVRELMETALSSTNASESLLDEIIRQLGSISTEVIPAAQRQRLYTMRAEMKLQYALRVESWFEAERALQLAVEKGVQVERSMNATGQRLRLAHYAASAPKKVWEILPAALEAGTGQELSELVVLGARAALQAAGFEDLCSAEEGLLRFLKALGEVKEVEMVLLEVQLALSSHHLKQAIKDGSILALEQALTLSKGILSRQQNFPTLDRQVQAAQANIQEAKLTLFQAAILERVQNQQQEAEVALQMALDALPVSLNQHAEGLTEETLEKFMAQPEWRKLEESLEAARALGSCGLLLGQAQQRLRWGPPAAALLSLLRTPDLGPQDIPGPLTDHILHLDGLLPDEGRFQHLHPGRKQALLRAIQVVQVTDSPGFALARKLVREAAEMRIPAPRKEAVRPAEGMPVSRAQRLSEDEVLDLVLQLGAESLRKELIRWDVPAAADASLVQLRDALIDQFLRLSE